MPFSEHKRQLRALVGHDLLMSPGAGAFIYDDWGRLLLQRRPSGKWILPGGGLEPDETPAEGVVREIWEEMGVRATPTRLHGVFTGPAWHVVHPNGDEDAILDVIFECKLDSEDFRLDGEEVAEVAYLSIEDALTLDLYPSDRVLLATATRRGPEALFAPATWQPPADGYRSHGIPEHERRLRAKIGHMRVLAPAVGVVVRDEAGRILVQRRADNGLWALPAGAMDPLETPADAARRETWEETGVLIDVKRITGIYGGPHYHFTYISSGDHAALLSIVLEGVPVGGTPTPDGHESTEVAYLPPDEVLAVVSDKWVRRLRPILEGCPSADFDPPDDWQPPAQD